MLYIPSPGSDGWEFYGTSVKSLGGEVNRCVTLRNHSCSLPTMHIHTEVDVWVCSRLCNVLTARKDSLRAVCQSALIVNENQAKKKYQFNKKLAKL